MNRTVSLTIAAVLAIAPTARAQCVGGPCDFRVLSGVLGYGAGSITHIGVPDRTMRGLNARMDLHILSLLLHGLPFRTYDAVVGDVTYGRRTSDSLPGLFQGDVEGTNGFQLTLGYQFLAGAVVHGVTLLGGLGWQESYHDIGGTTLDAKSVPIIARVEFGDNKRLVLVAWHSASGDATSGARIDVPFFRRLSLTAAYWTADGSADVWSSQSGGKVPGRSNLLVIGVRSPDLR